MPTDIRRRKRTDMNTSNSAVSQNRTMRILPIRRIVLLFLVVIFGTLFLLRQSIKIHIYRPVMDKMYPIQKNPEPKPRYELRTSFADDKSTMIHQKYYSMMDACRILQQCFVGSDVYGTPEVCKRNLDPTIRYYDSGFWVEVVEGKEDRLVGFLSIHHDISYKNRQKWQGSQQSSSPQADDYHALILYNVCVDEERRGKGIAKQMIPAFIDAMIKHYKLEKYADSNGKQTDPSTGISIPPLLIGLDVDLTSDMMPDAFSLYSKLGFVRWWTPCESVAHHRWTALIDTQISWNQSNQGYSSNEKRDDHGNVKKSTGLLPTRNSDFPLAKLLWDSSSYLENAFKAKSGKRHTHFCMYKFHSDSFQNMAKSLMEDSND